MKRSIQLFVLITILSAGINTAYAQCMTGFSIAPGGIKNVSCYGGNDAEITVQVSGGKAPFFYEFYATDGGGDIPLGSISSMNSTVTFTKDNVDDTDYGIPAYSDYRVRVKSSEEVLSGLGCNKRSIAGINITQPDPLSVTDISPNITPDCDATGSGSIDITVTGGTAPYTYIWSNGLPSQEDHMNTLPAGIYSVEIEDANGCTVSLADLVVTEFTLADAGVDQNFCDVTATLSGNTPNLNETGTWSSTNASITFADINDPNTVVSNLAAGANTLTWTVSDNNGGCADDIDEVIITVDEITMANAGVDQEVCIDNATLSANPAVGTEEGEWMVTAGTGIFADASVPNTTVTGLSPGTNEFTWTITNPGGACPPTSDLVSINYTDLTIADAGEDQTICDVTATLSGNSLKLNETGTWTSTNASIIFADVNDPNTVVNNLAAGANTLTWTVSDNNAICADNIDDVIITVDEITIANAGVDQDVCIDNATLSANPAVGTEEGEWTVTAGTGIFADSSVPNTTVTGLSPGTNEFTWTITNPGGACPPTSDLVSINYTDLTIADAGEDQTICDVTATLSGNSLKLNETGTWTSTNASIIFADVNDPNTVVNNLAAGANTLTWTVSDNNAICADNIDDVIITVDEITIANAGVDQDVCIDNATLSANPAVGTEEGEWTVTAGTGVFADASVPNTTVTSLSPGTNEFTWTITNPGGACPPTSDLVSINYTDLTIADAGVDQTICDVTATLSGNSLKLNETGTWTSTNASIIFADVNDPNTVVNNLAAGANTLTWTVSDNNAICADNIDDVIITVDEITIANAGVDQDVCIDNATLSANPAVGTEEGEWTVTAGTGIFADSSVPNTTVTGLSPGTNEFTWTITNPGGACPPTSDLVSINYTDLTIADAGEDQTICDVTATLSGNSLKLNETGTWTSTNASIIFADVNDPNTVVNNLAAGANTLTWTVSDNNAICADNIDDVIITVDEITIANAGVDQAVCIANATLSANQAVGTETGAWKVITGAGNFADASVHNTTVSGLTVGTNVFTWTITDPSSVCAPSADTLLINYTDLTIADAGADQTICDVTATLSGNTLKLNETGTWTSTNASITFADINDPNTVVNNLAAGANTLTWAVSDDFGVCTSNSDDVIITVDAITLDNIVATDATCNGATDGTITITASDGTPSYQYSLDGITFQASNMFNGLAAGTYTITVQDANLCSITTTATITEPVGLDAIASTTNVSCSGVADGAITVSASEGSAPYEYSLDGISYQANNTFNGLSVGSYTVTVRDANGCDFSFSVMIVKDAVETASVDIASDVDAICAGSPVNFTATPTNGGSAPTYQWFVNNVAVGGVTTDFTFSSSGLTDADAVKVEMTAGGTGIGCITGSPAMSDPITISVPGSLTASVTVSSDVSEICAGSPVVFTATPENGGSAPTYQWFINDLAIAGSTNVTFTTSALNDGDVVTVEMTAGGTGIDCISGSPATSAPSIISVPANQPVSVTIDSDFEEICAGSAVNFIASPVNGGTAPTYQWFINGLAVAGANSSTFTTSTLIDDDAVTVEMTADGTGNTCISGSPATSDPIVISVPGGLEASVSISPDITEVCPGDVVVFTATPVNGGSAPTYQWYVNDSAPVGETGETFTANGLTDEDEIFVEMTAGGTNTDCVTGSPAESDVYTITFSSTTLTASVDIASDVDEICAGSPVTFKATPTNGGSAPSYQWYINSTAVGAVTTDSTFTSSALNDADAITVEMTAGGTGIGCITGSPAMSDPIMISVPGSLTASVTVSSDVSEICAGSPVVFTATPENGGSAPTYQWFINDLAIAGSTNVTFTTSALNDGDAVTVEMTAGGTGIDCISGSPATSAPSIISVPANQPVSVTIDSDFEEICAGSAVNFIASPVNGGTAPTYQWFINGLAVAGANSSTFTTSTLIDDDAVTVEMTADGTGNTCISGSPATSDPIVISVPGGLEASVSISPDITEVCPGDVVVFTATPVNGGSAPTYQWYVNDSAPVGETGETFTANGLTDEDEIFVEMTAGGTNTDCVTGSPAESDVYTITFSSTTLTASVDIASDVDEICAGSPVTFKATPTNGGSAPSYQWYINSTAVGAVTTDSTFTSSALTDADAITVEMTAGGTGIGCITGSPAMSDPIMISVPGSLTASVTVSSDVSEICAGSPVVFTATPENGGSAPTYQWFINDLAIAGSTNVTFTTSALNDGDAVTVEMTAGGTGIDCISGSPATSAPSIISVPANQPVSVTIDSDFEEICAGSAVNFIASPVNGGTAPTFQWFINGIAVAGANSSTFTTSTLIDDDAVTVEMTADGTGNTCISGSPATSDPIVISVPGGLVASVSISPDITEVCPGDVVVFTATPVNGGSAPTYQWYVNDSAPVGETGETFTANGLTDEDEIFVEMTAGGTNTDCVTGSPAESDVYTITFSSTTLTASVDIASDVDEICAGSLVTFKATPTNGGSAPTYQWYINSTAVGAVTTDSTFTSSALNDADAITVEMTAGGTGIGCITGSPAMSDPITISVPGSLTASVTVSSDVSEICAGSPVVFTAAPENGGSAPTYQWFINGLAIAGSTNVTFTTSALNDGDAVTVEMTAGGTGIDCISGSPVVSAPLSIPVGGQASDPIVNVNSFDYCEGEVIADLEATGLDLKWYADAALTNMIGTGSPFATNLDSSITGTYSFYVTQTSSGCGESNAAEIIVSINATSPPPVVNDTLIEICQNDAIPTLSATGSGIVWYSDAALSSSVGSGPDYVPLASELDMAAAGSTIFYVTQNIGCGESVATEVTVTVRSGSSVPVVTSPVNVCQNTGAPTLTATGTNLVWYADAALSNQIGSGITYTPASSELDIATAGNTIFYVTQDTGCGESDPASVTVNIIDATDPLCAGGGGVNCGVLTITPIARKLPTCEGNNGFLTYAISGGTAPYLLRFIEGTDTLDFIGNSPITIPDLEAGTYSVIVRDGAGAGSNTCGPLSAYLEPYSTLTATANPDSFKDASCFGVSTGQAIINVTGGSGAFDEYLSDVNGVWKQFKSGDLLTDLPPNGTYNILVRDDASDNCPATVEVTINNPAEITISAQSVDATCNVNDGSIIINDISGGVSPYEVALEKDGEPLIFATYDPASPLVYQAINKGYHDVVIRDSNGCTMTIVMLVNAPNLVIFDLTPIAPTCENNGLDGKFLVNIDSYEEDKSYQYAITRGEAPESFLPVTKNLFLIENLSAGSYEVYITTDGQCINEQEEMVSGGATAVSLNIETSDISCFGDTGSLEIKNLTGAPSMNFNYTLLDEEGEESATGTINPNQALFGYSINGLSRGDYVLQVSQSQTAVNCIINASPVTFSIDGPTRAVQYDSLEVVASLPDQPTGSIKISGIDGGKAAYTAEIIDFNPTFLENTGYPDAIFNLMPNLDGIHYEVIIPDLYAGLYTIILTDGFGCEMEITIAVDYDRSIFIPNIFTPNGDLYNETFYIRNLPDAGSSLVVTNRWGKIVYTNKNYTNALSWNGDDLPDGVYYYKLLANDESFSGWVEIWRGKDKK